MDDMGGPPPGELLTGGEGGDPWFFYFKIIGCIVWWGNKGEPNTNSLRYIVASSQIGCNNCFYGDIKNISMRVNIVELIDAPCMFCQREHLKKNSKPFQKDYEKILQNIFVLYQGATKQ